MSIFLLRFQKYVGLESHKISQKMNLVYLILCESFVNLKYISFQIIEKRAYFQFYNIIYSPAIKTTLISE